MTEARVASEREDQRARATNVRSPRRTRTHVRARIYTPRCKKLVRAFIRKCERAIKQIRMEFHDEKGSARVHGRSEIARNAQSMKKLHFNASLLRN